MDIVLEDPKGWLVGIEVKTAAVVGSEDFKGLRLLGEAGGKHFYRGIVLYTGTETVPCLSFSEQVIDQFISGLFLEPT